MLRGLELLYALGGIELFYSLPSPLKPVSSTHSLLFDRHCLIPFCAFSYCVISLGTQEEKWQQESILVTPDIGQVKMQAKLVI